MDAPLTIACVYKPGGGFTHDYVDRLKIAAKKFCTLPHRFVCLTNQQLPGIETIQLKNGWIGWWNKLELFRKDLFPGPVAYFDLDTMFVSNVDDIVASSSLYEFACGTNWKGPGTHISSAVMCWDGRQDFSRVYDAFKPKVMQQYEASWERWGDQGFIQDYLPVPFTSLNETYPNKIISYKWHVRRQGRVPAGASVVCFHGKPRPHQVNWTLPNGN